MRAPATRRADGLKRMAALGGVAAVLATGANMALAAPAQADSARQLSGNVSCRGAEVSGVWVESATGGSDFAQIEEKARWGGLFSVSWEYTQPTVGSYYLVVGCGSNGKQWVTTVYSDSSDAAQSAWACNDIHPLWSVITGRFRALTLFDEAVETDVPYGRCQQV